MAPASRDRTAGRARTLDAVVIHARVMLAANHHSSAVVMIRYALREFGHDGGEGNDAAGRERGDERLLRLLAQALDALGRYGEVLDVLARLDAAAHAVLGEGSPVDLMAARALLAMGRVEGARERFALHKAALAAGFTAVELAA